MNQQWAPVPIHLLQKPSSKGGRDEVFASAEVTSDRRSGIERSAREYARRWNWSPGSVLRFMNDCSNFIDFSTLNSDGTHEATNNAGSGGAAEQGRNKMLTKANKTLTEQLLNGGGTLEANNYAGSGGAAEQEQNNGRTETEQLFSIEKKREEPYPSSPSKVLFDLWNKTAEGTPLPAVREFSSTRAKKCSARLKERSLDEWAAIFRQIADTPFLCGAKGWKATFDWIIANDGNAAKVLEGTYEDRTASISKPSDNRYADIFAGA